MKTKAVGSVETSEAMTVLKVQSCYTAVQTCSPVTPLFRLAVLLHRSADRNTRILIYVFHCARHVYRIP